MAQELVIPSNKLYTLQESITKIKVDSINVAKSRGITIPFPKVVRDPHSHETYLLTDGNHRVSDMLENGTFDIPVVEDNLTGKLSPVQEAVKKYLDDPKKSINYVKVGNWQIYNQYSANKSEIFVYPNFSKLIYRECLKYCRSGGQVYPIPIIPGVRENQFHALNPEYALALSKTTPKNNRLRITVANDFFCARSTIEKAIAKINNEINSNSYDGISLKEFNLGGKYARIK